MKWLFYIIFSFHFLSSISQNVTFEDIVFGRTHTLPQTRDYLLKKGYKFIGESKANWPSAKKYTFGKGTDENGTQYSILMTDKADEINAIEIMLENDKTFIAIKNKIKEQGFKLDEMINNPDPFNETFVKKDKRMDFSSHKEETIGNYYSIYYN